MLPGSPLYKLSATVPAGLADFIISYLCLDVPYYFIDRFPNHRVDEESGVGGIAPMLAIGACSCTMESSDSVTRIGDSAIIFAIYSNTVLGIKSELERSLRSRAFDALGYSVFSSFARHGAVQGASITDASLVKRPFGEYTQLPMHAALLLSW
ncbi:hypothetical protein JOM56_012110 [Amanita muscaria]